MRVGWRVKHGLWSGEGSGLLRHYALLRVIMLIIVFLNSRELQYKTFSRFFWTIVSHEKEFKVVHFDLPLKTRTAEKAKMVSKISVQPA